MLKGSKGMKKLSYIVFVVIALGLFISGCQKSQMEAPSYEPGAIILTEPGDTCGVPTVVNLLASYVIDVGTVTVWNDESALYVNFKTSGDWVLIRTDLAVATTLDSIPQFEDGCPAPFFFPYQMYHDSLTEFTYAISLNGWDVGTELYISTHSFVYSDGYLLEAWGYGIGFPGCDHPGAYFIHTIQPCDTLPPPPDTGCTFTQGYWKNHPNAWPVVELTLGTVTYSKDQLLSILHQPVRGNGLVALARQLIAAKLNEANGAMVPQGIAEAINASDELIDNLIVPPIGDGHLHPSLTSDLVEILDLYNNGEYPGGPPHCDD
jgi:hypothetical protein